ncbi:hypothetical protein CHLRE_04g217918v5 [Chlamydomonas reinhardtii]|nr:uncharacterized protein CHLRE_04g217918v5 [Chlamydomonas reinhardtii]PNW83813.1 hypothetical protein CHLRE_04g217918v5 [Chlamydomonas reinhardtii]
MLAPEMTAAARGATWRRRLACDWAAFELDAGQGIGECTARALWKGSRLGGTPCPDGSYVYEEPQFQY